MSTSSTQRSRVDEEDDLDDLDDVLDQFVPPAQPTAKNTNASASTSTSAQPSQPPKSAPDAQTDDALTNELEAEFAKQMASLLKEFGASPNAGSEGAGADGVGATEQAQLAAAWEAMLVEGMDAMSDPSASASTSAPNADTDFQSSIRSTMNRLRESESGLRPSDSSAGVGDETLESLLSQLGGLGEGGPQSEAELEGMLEKMMGQLMSKDVLYEPLKELYEKFPGYLAEHANTMSSQDKERYDAQISCIKRLIAEFEANTYRDDDEKAHERIVALMSELQAHGQPPEEIMGPLPPGFNLGADGLPDMPDGCNLN